MSLDPGTRLGPYEILAPIGAGGMGEVYKARDTRLNRIVAIKVSKEQFSERFEQEARAVAALNHPHIYQLYDVGPNYLVMEFVEGAPLKGPLPLEKAVEYSAQILDALDAAHQKGITHRDLKPANILVTKQGIKLLDFGLAKQAVRLSEDDATKALTDQGQIVGTLHYMSPEQLQGKEADARSDLFSFGCVLYETLLGKRAFEGRSPASVIAAILEREPAPLTVALPLERILKRCLAKDPDLRFQTARDLRAALTWALEGDSTASVARPIAEHRLGNARFGWLLSAILAAVLIVALFTIFRYSPATATAVVIRSEILPPEGTTWGSYSFPAISPDGSRIMFAATKHDGTSSLWIRPMDSVIAQPIPGTEGAVYTGAWSPDGRSIAYAADGKLRKLELNGGPPQILGSVRTFAVPAWSSVGVILFTGAESPNSLYQIPASGGEAKAVTGSGSAQFYPSFLPGGRSFLYCTAASGTPNGGAIYIGALDSNQSKRLAAGICGVFVPPAWLLSVRDSTLVAESFDVSKQLLSGEPIPIADQVVALTISSDSTSWDLNGGGFSASQNVLAYRRALPPPPSDLTWYDRQGKRLGVVGEHAVYSNPALSPDGKRLAVGRHDPVTNTRDIWVLDLMRGVSSRLTFDKADDLNPVWSPDGSRIAFSSTRKGTRNIYWKAAGGAGDDELLLEAAGGKSLEDWSADGKLLLFNLSNQEIDALPMSGDRKPYPVLKAPFPQENGRLSPDGHWIAYVSQEFGRREVFVKNFPPAGGKWQISTSGGTEPSWRRDGKEIYFMSGTILKAVKVKAAGSTFELETPKDLFDVPIYTLGPVRRNHYVAAPDGQRFLFVTTPRTLDTTPFIVVQNWQTALKR